jgi:predicted DNA-binding ribbon-helix-helix protein
MKVVKSFTLEEKNIQELVSIAKKKNMTASELLDSIIELYLLNGNEWGD